MFQEAYARVQTFFIGRHLDRARDSFESATIKLILSFFIAFLLVAMAFIPFYFMYPNRLFTFVNFGILLLYMVPFAILKYSRSYEIASFLFASTIVLGASINSAFCNGLLTPNISVWYFIAVAFGAYTLRPRYIISVVIILFLCLAVIDSLKYYDLLMLNPYFSEKENLHVTPFIMLFTFPLIIKLLIEYVKSKQAAINTVKNAITEKDKILGIVAHDLRNPVGAAVNCIELCNRYIQKDQSQKIEKYLSLANDSCTRALGHIEELLEISNLKENGNRLPTTNEDIVPFVQSLVDVYSPQALKKKIKLHFSPPQTPVVVSINKLRFSRVLDNVISNAIKFTKEDGEINVRVETERDTTTIRISDTGIGIPKSLQNTLFTEYTPAAREGTDHEQSTGLGMAIAKKIVGLHRGEIWFESEENKGTVFFIRLPQQSTDA